MFLNCLIKTVYYDRYLSDNYESRILFEARVKYRTQKKLRIGKRYYRLRLFFVIENLIERFVSPSKLFKFSIRHPVRVSSDIQN